MRAGLIARDLRGGLAALWVVIAALALGVAAMAVLGSVDRSLRDALVAQGAELLGGDVEVTLASRAPAPNEAAVIEGLGAVSGVLRMRSMASANGGRALAELRAVDNAWPLVGEASFTPPLPVAEVLAGRDGLPGAAMAPDLAARLGLNPGDRFEIAGQPAVLMATIARLPDGLGGMGLAPTVLAPRALGDAIAAPGAFYETATRIRLSPGVSIPEARDRLTEALPEGTRLRDSRRAVPGADRFLDRIGSFLMLASVAGLALGGIGIAAAVGDWLARKAPEIATWRALGATSGQIRALVGGQVAVAAGFGLAGGLALAGAALALADPLLAGRLPAALVLRADAGAFGRAAGVGALVAALAAAGPLSALARMRAAAIWRGETALPRPGALGLALVALGIVALAALVVASAPAPRMAAAVLAVMVGVMAVVAALAMLMRRALAALPRPGPAALRLALAALAARRGGLTGLVTALGLGLTLMAAATVLQANLSRAITADIPDRAPAFFVIDIQPDQTAPVLARLTALPGVTEVRAAPMLRGTVTALNGVPAREAAPDSWVIRGDRGLSFAATPPEDTRLVAGHWWAADDNGPPQVSFSQDEAEELGLGLGDTVTVSVLGREITATITSLRPVDFRSAGLGFVMILNPAALAGAPHTTIATVRATPGADAAIPAALADWPNVSAIGVREVAAQLVEGLGLFALITRIGAGLVLASGVVVLAGAASAGQRARRSEAAIARALGASTGQIARAGLIRLALGGALAGGLAAALGTALAYVVTRQVLDLPFAPVPLAALAVLAGGVALTLAIGAGGALRAARARPARLLRAD